jgi:hypothetical protein
VPRTASLLCLTLVACGAAKQRRAEEHLRNELNFYRAYVDVDSEEAATRRVLAQRNLVVEEEARGEGFRALGASSIDHKRSAVRIISRRGVVAAEDADADDWFALRNVALWTVGTRAALPETLVGIQKTARGQEAPCLTLYRLEPDGRVSEVEFRVQLFGSHACVSSLSALDKSRFEAVLAWPGLSAGVAPRLRVELRSVTRPLNAPSYLPLALRLADDDPWVERAGQELGEAPSAIDFPERQARAVALAALALAKHESVDQQLGSYRSALGGARTGTYEAEIMAATVAHIRRAWQEEGDAPTEGDAGDDVGRAAPSPEDGPSLAPDDVVIEPDAGG